MRTGENVIRWCGGACRDIEKKDSRNVMVTGSIAVSFSTTFDEEDDDVLVVIDNSGASKERVIDPQQMTFDSGHSSMLLFSALNRRGEEHYAGLLQEPAASDARPDAGDPPDHLLLQRLGQARQSGQHGIRHLGED